MFRFNIVITEACNAKCSHCYMGNIKNPKTMTQKEIETIIKKIPKDTESIVLTGGEIFLKKSLLEFAIKQIKTKNPKIKIGLETNGIYFYKKNEKAKEELQHLREIGVDSIRFSDDPFHEEGGVDLKKVRELKELEDESTPILKYLIQEKALAIGKAQKLRENQVEKRNCMNHEDTLNNPYLFLDAYGDVYICTWKCIPPIGNMIKEDMNDILKRLQDDFYHNILKGSIKKAMKMKNNPKENEQIIKEHGECMLCSYIFQK